MYYQGGIIICIEFHAQIILEQDGFIDVCPRTLMRASKLGQPISWP